MSDIELLPCPFCGGAPEQEPENGGLGSFWIICDNVGIGCGCEGPYKHSPDDAVAAWNRREAPDRAARIQERYAAALKQIAAPRDCGCSPICQCNSQSSLEIEVGELREIARNALSSADDA
jgi:Lar family restriction alleviation protein